MKRMESLAGALLALSQLFLPLPAPAQTPPAQMPAQAKAQARPPVTILISIDGFRADYLDRGITPNLSALARRGISASMRPSFPSKTFPNHWTLVTGKVPDHHGIVANSFDDPRRPDDHFTMASDDPFWWNAAQPIWVTAEKAGIRTATMFWPGSNVAWGGQRVKKEWTEDLGGTRPSDWQQYNKAVAPAQRVAAVIDWLRRPAATRPRLVTLYFDQVDTAGHHYGPDDPRTDAAIAEADRDIGLLEQGLAELGQPADLVVVADHGMAATSSERTIALDAVANPAWYRLGDTGPFAAITPNPGKEKRLATALLKPHAHMQCWRRQDIPARLRYGSNDRIAPYFCLAQTGWLIAKTAPHDRSAVTGHSTGGAHGYDNAAPEMAALFIAAGPHVRAEGRLPAFDNVDVEPLLRDLLGLPQASDGDGEDAPFRTSLKGRE